MSDNEIESVSETFEINNENNIENLDSLWSIRNTILYASIVYLLINIIYTIFNIWYIIPVFLLMFGFIGIKNYSSLLSFYFFIYLVIKLCIEVNIVFNTNNTDVDIFLLTLLIVLKIYLCELTLKFYIKVCNLSKDDLNKIKDNYIPSRRNLTLY
jgi:hypothetical protein